jgi:hypothetical protein
MRTIGDEPIQKLLPVRVRLVPRDQRERWHRSLRLLLTLSSRGKVPRREVFLLDLGGLDLVVER